MAFQRLMTVALVLEALLIGCTQPNERPRDGSTRIGRETPAPTIAAADGSVSNVTIRFIEEAELTATAIAAIRTPQVGTPAPQAISVTPVASPISAAASPSSLIGRTPGWRIVRTDLQGVRLRATPATAGATVGSLSEGTLVNPIDGPVAADGARWIQVEASGGRRGWVDERYLEPPPIPTILALPVGSPGSQSGFVIGQTDGAGANVREGPSTSAQLLGNLPEGTLVEPVEAAIGDDGRPWRRVRGNGMEGWVLAVVVRPR